MNSLIKTYRYFAILSFFGKNYHGWQIQPNAISVQSVLQEKMSLILKEPVELVGAGRTDTGVHAGYFVAHFELNNEIGNISEIVFKLNRFLPEDITISTIVSVPVDLHARFSAISRTYKYFIHTKKNSFISQTSYYHYGNLDIEKMNIAADMLKNFSDFSCFCKTHADNKTNLCKIYEAYWINNSNLLVFTIKADRFLRNMVRAIVGTLLDIGKNKISFDDFQNIIRSGNRSNAGDSMPAHGLFLTDIEYPVDIPKNESVQMIF